MRTKPKNRKFNSSRQRRVIPRFSFIEIKNYKLLKSLRRNFNDRLNVTFNLLDGSKKILPLNNEFFLNEKNRKLNESTILAKLNTLKHDFGAENYIINKLF